ncbi:MAG: 5'/3'-nucleotidase SurE [Armatimonadetes bacterium]|nr:5'/3'-nucleotidase SurE [Armatimonadota bacterium]
MRILITNDDGINAPGIRSLLRVARQFGEVKIVAPDRERSACGHSMTLRDPLRVRQVDCDGVEGFEVNGVPVDCVNVGLRVAWPDGCDLVLSGINNGPNLGFDITYSGTVGGAMEACINGIPGIAVSMASFVDGAPLHFETGEKWLTENFEYLVGLPRRDRVFLNVNIPAIEFSEINGHKFVSMGRRVYEDRVEERSDPWGRQYFWQGGVVVVRSDEPGTDVQAVSTGYVSITPISLNWSDQAAIDAYNAL